MATSSIWAPSILNINANIPVVIGTGAVQANTNTILDLTDLTRQDGYPEEQFNLLLFSSAIFSQSKKLIEGKDFFVSGEQEITFLYQLSTTLLNITAIDYKISLTYPGFRVLGKYEDGPWILSSESQLIEKDGALYVPIAGNLPFTTTGVWAGADENLFTTSTFDDTLRQDLASSDVNKGAALVTYMNQPLSQRLAKIRYVTDYTSAQAAINSGAHLLVWPEGEYVVTTLDPAKNQVWLGTNRDKVIITWAQQNIPSLNYSMMQSTGDVENFYVKDITFKGNRPFQTTESVDNQDMGCFRFRTGDVINFGLENCVIRDFGMLGLKGDNTTSGHGVSIGNRKVGVSAKKIRNIRIKGNEFRDNSNVPGVYICGEATASNFVSEMTDIAVYDNDFVIDITTAIQNCIYILGDATTVGNNIKSHRNKFKISQPSDCAIEYNYLTDYWADDNEFYATGTGTFTPVLIRDGTADGSICNNRIRSTSSGTGNAAGIAVITFTSGVETQSRINIKGNHINNWGTSSNGCAFNISTGSANVELSDNFITGESSSNRIECGVILGSGAKNVRMTNNVQKFVKYPVKYAGNATGCEYSDNLMESCGDGASSLILSNALGYSVTVNTIARNTVLTPIAGTSHLVSIASTANTRNRVLDNNIPATLALVNPSYLSSQETIRTVATGIGKGVIGTQYQFAQGALSIPNASGFTLGANLDSQAPVCKPGDFVIFTYVGNAQGATIGQGYCPVSGQVRTWISNHTGATINIPAGNWNVLIIPS